LPENYNLKGFDCEVTITSNAELRIFDGVIEGIKFIGTRTASLNAYESPLIAKSDLTNYSTYIDRETSLIFLGSTGVNRITRVDKCSFLNIDKNCIKFIGANYVKNNQPSVSENNFDNCKSAITNCEYSQILNNKIFNCTYGIVIESGNTFLSNNLIYNNSCGIVINDIGNGAHGCINNGGINHNSIAGIYVKNCQNSEVISGVNMFDSPILVDYSEGLNFTGCLIDTYFEITNGKTNQIACTIFRSGWQAGNPRFTFPVGALSLKLNMIQGSTDHSSVNN